MKTKQLIALMIGFCLTITSVYSQSAKSLVGIKGGYNASNLYIDDVNDRNPRNGFHVGLFYQAPISKNLYFGPEILFSTKGVTANYNNFNGLFTGENTFKLNYIDVPLVLTYKLGKVVDLQVGGYGGYLLSASNSITSASSLYSFEFDKSNFNDFDYGVLAGINIYFGKVFIGTRYNHGLGKVASTDMAKGILGDSKNSYGQVSLGFSF